MAEVTDPFEIAFCDEQIRIAADKLAQAYYFANGALDLWFAQGHSSAIPNTSDAIKDSANPQAGVADGRPPITGANVHNLATRISELVTDYEASSSAKLNTILAVSPQPQG